MLAKFQVEAFITSKKEVQVFCRYLTEHINFRVSDSSFLGPFPIKNKMFSVRTLEKDGKRKIVRMFILKNAIDKDKICENDIFEMWDDFVEVIGSYQIPIGMVAFLRSNAGKYEEEYELEDNTSKKWVLKKYFKTTGSFETYEKTEIEENEGIFQYLIAPVDHGDKPVVGTKLKINRRS